MAAAAVGIEYGSGPVFDLGGQEGGEAERERYVASHGDAIICKNCPISPGQGATV